MTGSQIPRRVFRIIVADNFRYQDKEAEYEIEGSDTAAEAVKKCEAIVDASLRSCAEPGSSAADIFFRYQMFGEDPFIIGTGDDAVQFSAWTYAQKRAEAFVKPA